MLATAPYLHTMSNMPLRTIYAFARLSARRKILLTLALIVAFYSQLVEMGGSRYLRFAQRDPKGSLANEHVLHDIRWAIRIVNERLFTSSVCRHTAFQAMVLCHLYKQPYTIYVGFKKNESGSVEGHAWTCVGGHMITGFCNPDEYRVVQVFRG